MQLGLMFVSDCQDCIRCCQEQIEQAVTRSLHQSDQQQQPGTAGAPDLSANQHAASALVAKTTDAVAIALPTTPTDIREVHPD